ncbi:MAG: response regulator transcription factor [Anaeromicrobium sp.]|jgi:DNA-binding response OmpR family regulator|uniref:response regulator transcription factor n=1 Tax=Anaeromicrobium sp. TaxID=1929132 RepID=UPI0025FBBDAE|nr:response regulator transcription factor [Anaeromicrobium sp.]MCT4593410.1 response regulator transcription factor [Anaeromicrobium sp.]
MKKIIIVEDTETIREELKIFLSKYGYEVYAPDDFNNIIEDISRSNGDLILLDINLPVFDGYYICREVRKNSDVPIIVVTSRDSQMDELMSMNLGADDFITKPYNTQILLARISAVLKRTSKSNHGDVLMHKDIQLNILKGCVIHKGNMEQLTKNELKILSCLMKNKGTIVSREKLMEYLWNSHVFIDDNTLSVNITRLRKTLQKIGAEDVIETRRGLGYIMT